MLITHEDSIKFYAFVQNFSSEEQLLMTLYDTIIDLIRIRKFCFTRERTQL